MTPTSPQLHPVIAPLRIVILDRGRAFRVVLPAPEDGEMLAEVLRETVCQEMYWNSEWFEWVGVSRSAMYRDYMDMVIADLQAAWVEAHEQLEPAPGQLALPPAPGDVGKGMRGLIQMAQEMGMDYRELEMRLRNGWPYKITERQAALIPIDDTGEFEHRVEYFFNKAHAKWNVENKDKVKEPPRKRPQLEEDESYFEVN